LGDLGIGLSPDANAIYWNTAKLAFAEKDLGVSLTYTPWLKELVNDIYLADLSAYKRIDKLQTITASLRYFSLGSITFTDASGNTLNTFNPREFAFNVGYARQLSDNFAVGINLGYIYSNLASGQQVNAVLIKPGKAADADISFNYNHKAKFGTTKGKYNIGLTLSNLGNKMTYTSDAQNKDFLPTNLGIGTGVTFIFDDYNQLTLLGEVNKLLVPIPDSAGNYRSLGVPAGVIGSFTDATLKEEFQELNFSVGVEYWYKQQFALRAGFFDENKYFGDRKYLTAGIGIKYSVFGLNFSYLVPTEGVKNPLDNTLRFSLLFDFDKAALEKKAD
jgi:hypothetical protein